MTKSSRTSFYGAFSLFCCNHRKAILKTRTEEIMTAITNDDTAKIQRLKQRDIDHAILDENNMSPLMLAAKQGSYDIVLTLLHQNHNPDQQNKSNGNTSMHYAAENGHVDTLALLLEYTDNPNATNHDGQTVLHASVQYPKCTEMLLNNKQIELNIKSSDGKVALQHALAAFNCDDKCDVSFLETSLHLIQSYTLDRANGSRLHSK